MTPLPSLLAWPVMALLATSNTRPASTKPSTTRRTMKRSNNKHHVTTEHHATIQRLKQSNNNMNKGIVWVDLENVRGKSGFELSHMDVLQQTSQWAQHYNLSGQVMVVADHGSLTAAYYDEDMELGIVFSGNHQKADDVLARSVDYSAVPDDTTYQGESIVITADTELQGRCRRAAKNRPLHIWDPQRFLDDLEMTTAAAEAALLEQDDDIHEDNNNSASPPAEASLEEQIQLGKLDMEITLRAQILDAQIQLDQKRSKSKLTNKKRKKIQTRLNGLKSKLALKGPSLLDQVTSLDGSTTGKSSSPVMNSREQDLLLKRWKEIKHASPHREQTGDRVVLAEQLRRQLMEMDSVTSYPANDMDNKEENNDSPVKSFVVHFNERESFGSSAATAPIRESETSGDEISGESATSSRPNPPVQTTFEILKDTSNNPLESLDTIQIVAVSDTHGYESQLLNDDSIDENGALADNEILPSGDILLHLGDFALEGSPNMQRESLKAVDNWLAKQPHPIKIVVRGNHDPLWYPFERSGAWFITEPTTVDLSSSLKLGVMPHGTPKRWKSRDNNIPQECDILASHVPPLKILDRTYTGKSAGSGYLTRTVHAMGSGAPRLWLCGHIHEGRGVTQNHFGGTKLPTTVINAANANYGRATHLVHGAVVLQLDVKDETKPVEIISMKDKSIEERIGSDGKFFRDESERQEAVQELLLAVDLGLKSGVALFGRDGTLLRYEQFHFEKKSLVEAAKHLVESWESTVNEVDEEEGGLPHRITHIALEGANGYMLQAWADARSDLSILRVPPEEWRADLLLAKERTSGSNAKAASRLIARQIVDDFGVMSNHQGKFTTDVAEAVCMGFYVGRKLGWIEEREPAVRRFMNGKIIVPRK